MLHHLTETRNVQDMFKRVKQGDYIEFTPTKYDAEQVIEMAQQFGFLTRYCKKGSEAYKRYGQYVIYVKERLPPNMRNLGAFDTKDLTVNFQDKFVEKCKKVALKRNGVLV